MPKAMIITVGTQGAQIKISLDNRKPEYVVLLGTNSPKCKDVINEVLNHYKLNSTNYKIYNDIKDYPSQIGGIIENFRSGLKWLAEQGIQEKDIEVDPTGGRKWMSAGVIMIASFLGMKMCYVQDKSESEPEKVTSLGNAYDQTGFVEEDKANKLFNENNFAIASSIYNFLSQKVSDPRQVEIKKLISDSYLNWSQFKFTSAFSCLEQAINKINQYKILDKYLVQIKNQYNVMNILKRNEREQYYNLLKSDKFVKQMLLTLFAQSERFAESKQYDQAVIILYRILEFIAQHRLAKNNIDAGKITRDIQEKYKEKYKQLTKKIFNAGSEIPDKIALVQCWILLYCLEDKLVKNEKEDFIKGLRGKTELRNLLWWEHGNKVVDEDEYKRFKEYITKNWLLKIIPTLKKTIKKHCFIKF